MNGHSDQEVIVYMRASSATVCGCICVTVCVFSHVFNSILHAAQQQQHPQLKLACIGCLFLGNRVFLNTLQSNEHMGSAGLRIKYDLTTSSNCLLRSLLMD